MRRILISTVLLAVAVSLAGCSASNMSASDQSAPNAVPLTTEGTQLVKVEAGDFASSGRVVAGVEQADRSVVTTGTVTITAKDPISAAGEATRIVEGAGGRVDARTETAPTEHNQGAATLTLRVPSATLTTTLDKLKALGKTQDVALSAVDVTTQSQDLDARITALRASVDRLTVLLTTATDTDVLIKLESAISERQGNLESMEAQQRQLADQVSLSTIDLQLVSVTDAPVEQPDTFWSGLAAGWGAFVGFVGFLLVAFGVLLPWIVVAGIVAAAVLFVLKWTRRRRAAVEPAA